MPTRSDALARLNDIYKHFPYRPPSQRSGFLWVAMKTILLIGVTKTGSEAHAERWESLRIESSGSCDGASDASESMNQALWTQLQGELREASGVRGRPQLCKVERACLEAYTLSFRQV